METINGTRAELRGETLISTTDSLSAKLTFRHHTTWSHWLQDKQWRQHVLSLQRSRGELSYLAPLSS